MNIEEKAFLWLNMCDFIGHKKAFGLIEKYGSATKVMENIDDFKDTLKPGDYEKAKHMADTGYLDIFIKNKTAYLILLNFIYFVFEHRIFHRTYHEFHLKPQF